ncbi:MAG: hypothetical protein ABSF88_08360 [Candidatus Aminicenantales bacterium]
MSINLLSRRTANILKLLQIFFYAAFVFLWFKDNFLLFKKIHISSAIPLVPLILITAIRAFAKFKSAPPKLRFPSPKDGIALALILVLSTAVHVPYLVHHNGLMDSDEAIPALQGKHIAEGKMPTLYYYSARFQGSLPQHYYALLFRLFGYSILLVKLAAYLAFTAFLLAQFFLLKNLFSSGFATSVCLFYCLPFKHLILSSFDIGSGFPVVFLFGSLIFILTRKIYDQGMDRLLGTLGFVMGLAFWTHQIAIVFILTSAIFLALRYKFRMKRYWTLAWSFALGLLPLFIGEIYWHFPLMRMLFGGETAGLLKGNKVVRLGRLTLGLLSSGSGFISVISLALLLLGLAVIVIPSLKTKRLRSSSLFAVYSLVFTAVYLLSASSSDETIRYLYVLYLALPVLFAAAFLWIKPKAPRYALTGLLFVLVFLGGGAKASLAHFGEIKDLHADLRDVMAAMTATGEKYWDGDYWVSYLINAVSRERLIVASTTVERYPYYRLIRDSEGVRTNRIFFLREPDENKNAQALETLLGRLHKTYEKKTIRQFLLFSGINGYIYRKNMFYPPDDVPNVTLAGIEATAANLEIRFTASPPLLGGGFRINVEIPGSCAAFTPIGPGEKFSVHVPYPPERRVRLKYFLDAQGLYLDSTLREKDLDLPAPPGALKKNDVEFLSGFGPHESATGRNWQALDKDARFRINRPLGESSKISLKLYSPFNFADIIYWSGDFPQVVDIFVNDRFAGRKTLPDGHNTLEIDGRFFPSDGSPCIITLKFKYAMVISDKSDHWRTAAYLENLKVD